MAAQAPSDAKHHPPGVSYTTAPPSRQLPSPFPSPCGPASHRRTASAPRPRRYYPQRSGCFSHSSSNDSCGEPGSGGRSLSSVSSSVVEVVSVVVVTVVVGVVVVVGSVVEEVVDVVLVGATVSSVVSALDVEGESVVPEDGSSPQPASSNVEPIARATASGRAHREVTSRRSSLPGAGRSAGSR